MVVNFCLVSGVSHQSTSKGRPQPRLLNILHATITITIRDYEIQLITITITWYGFLKRHSYMVTYMMPKFTKLRPKMCVTGLRTELFIVNT